jgi:phage anti-repressor protein
MARVKTEKKVKEIKNKTSNNLKSGKFDRKELILYGLKDDEIELILNYQKILPVLQEDNDKWINTRDLHMQLKLKKHYTEWMDNVIEQLDLENFKDYHVHFKGNVNFTEEEMIGMNSQQRSRYGISENYYTNIENAKEIAMISGIGNRVNQETKDISKMARKYFIHIEKAFKNRLEWNMDRDDTLIKCKTLRGAIIKYKNELNKTRPTYYNNNFISEFCLLNEVIIGMSASQYRRLKGLDKNTPIRNTFTEKELEIVHILEQYDSDLILIQNEFDWSKRKEYLSKKLHVELVLSA